MRHLIRIYWLLAFSHISVALGGPTGDTDTDLPSSVTDIDGEKIEIGSTPAPPIILEWVNFACPCVRDHYKAGTMPKLQRQASARGARWVSIASTGDGMPGFMRAEGLREASEEAGARPGHLVLDKDGTLAQSFEVVSSPHVILLVDGKVFYSGPPAEACGRDEDGNMIETGRVYLAEAIDAALSGGQPPVPTGSKRGCLLRVDDVEEKVAITSPFAAVPSATETGDVMDLETAFPDLAE